MTKFDPTTKLTDIKLTDYVVRALSWCGYNVLSDFDGMKESDILRLPGMSGSQYRKLMAALGREPYPWRTKKPRGIRSSTS